MTINLQNTKNVCKYEIKKLYLFIIQRKLNINLNRMRRITIIIFFISSTLFLFAAYFVSTNKSDNSIVYQTVTIPDSKTDVSKEVQFNGVTDVEKELYIVDSNSIYKVAVDEIIEMLHGIKPLSFKRAVFLSENAYYDGMLDYNVFCTEIERIKAILHKMIIAKNLQNFKTAGNWAIFDYLTDTIPENNFKPYTYDIENLLGPQDSKAAMVSNLLKTRKGNCHSLPYLYKILADEMNVEAFLALAPLHFYIRHRDEQGKWWNLELTTGTFSRTSFIIESFDVPDDGIESGLYMKALSEKESVALCLYDLLAYYDKKTGIYYGELVRTAYTEGIKVYPNSLFQLYKANDEKYDLDMAMKEKGLTDYDKIKSYPELVNLSKKFNTTKDYIKKIGYYTYSVERYGEKMQEIRKMQQEMSKNK